MMTAANGQINGTLLSVLSYDAMLEVMSHLNIQELGRLSSVSAEAKEIVDDQIVWRQRCRTLEGDWTKVLRDASQGRHIEANGMWKDAFRSERKRLHQFSPYVGLWSEKWCDVNVVQSTQIETDGTNFFVTYRKNKFSARFLNFSEEDGLSFHLEGGDSGWSFIYTLKPITKTETSPNNTTATTNTLHLTVFRVHDRRVFNGVYTRNT